MKGSNRIFHLRCNTKDSYEIWKEKLQHSIGESAGKNKKLTMDMYKEEINQYFDFWRYLRISEDAFKFQAEVGDLILCISKKSFGKGVVDKLCIVVKLDTGNNNDCLKGTDTNELFVLRVGMSMDQGIVLQSWDEFRIYKS